MKRQHFVSLTLLLVSCASAVAREKGSFLIFFACVRSVLSRPEKWRRGM